MSCAPCVSGFGSVRNSNRGARIFRDGNYSPTLQRRMQEDPLGYVDGMNLYAYVREAPLALKDPEGLIPLQLPDPGGCLPPFGGLGTGFCPIPFGPPPDRSPTNPGVSIYFGPILLNNQQLDYDFDVQFSGLKPDTEYAQVVRIEEHGVNKSGKSESRPPQFIVDHFSAFPGSKWTPDTVVVDHHANYGDTNWISYVETRTMTIYEIKNLRNVKPGDKFLGDINVNGNPIKGGGNRSAVAGRAVLSWSFTYKYNDCMGTIRESIKFSGLTRNPNKRFRGGQPIDPPTTQP
jgi:RHS repeat-associated protein